jgi:hypothetical protein
MQLYKQLGIPNPGVGGGGNPFGLSILINSADFFPDVKVFFFQPF